MNITRILFIFHLVEFPYGSDCTEVVNQQGTPVLTFPMKDNASQFVIHNTYC